MAYLPSPEMSTAFKRALDAAESFSGATSPNPPVGAAALDRHGRILGLAAHERAGTAHAEAKLLKDLTDSGEIMRLATLVVTLEPCNHHGRTPPCTGAILRAREQAPGFKTLWIAVRDPNPRVTGGGIDRLRAEGFTVIELDAQDSLSRRARALIAPFIKQTTQGLPYVTVKTAWRQTEGGSLTLVPPPGAKTFTSEEAIRRAHALRRRADAILTGSGTILADQPLFTVRAVADFSERQGPLATHPRELIIMDRTGCVSPEYLAAAQSHGFSPRIETDLLTALQGVAARGGLEVLVEAGPRLTQSVLESGLWDEHVVITQSATGEESIDSVLPQGLPRAVTTIAPEQPKELPREHHV